MSNILILFNFFDINDGKFYTYENSKQQIVYIYFTNNIILIEVIKNIFRNIDGIKKVALLLEIWDVNMKRHFTKYFE